MAAHPLHPHHLAVVVVLNAAVLWLLPHVLGLLLVIIILLLLCVLLKPLTHCLHLVPCNWFGFPAGRRLLPLPPLEDLPLLIRPSHVSSPASPQCLCIILFFFTADHAHLFFNAKRWCPWRPVGTAIVCTLLHAYTVTIAVAMSWLLLM